MDKELQHAHSLFMSGKKLEAYEILKDHLDTDDKEIRTDIGVLYRDGIGFKKDLGKAFDILSDLFKELYGWAYHYLAEMYELDEYGPKSYPDAYFVYFLGAIDCDDRICRVRYDDYNKNKEIMKQVIKDYESRIKNKDIPILLAILGTVYVNGYGVEKDRAKAYELAKRGAKLDDERCITLLANMYQNDGEYAFALKWYLKANELGNEYVSKYIAEYYSGEYEAYKPFKDLKKALEYYNKYLEHHYDLEVMIKRDDVRQRLYFEYK